MMSSEISECVCLCVCVCVCVCVCNYESLIYLLCCHLVNTSVKIRWVKGAIYVSCMTTSEVIASINKASFISLDYTHCAYCL